MTIPCHPGRLLVALVFASIVASPLAIAASADQTKPLVIQEQ